MRKHTTMNLDQDLVREAQEILGTTQVTETVHRALQEVVNRRHRRAVLAYDFPGLTPDSLEEMRRSPIMEIPDHLPPPDHGTR
jgi:Arc/MetJ family transcription regulator